MKSKGKTSAAQAQPAPALPSAAKAGGAALAASTDESSPYFRGWWAPKVASYLVFKDGKWKDASRPDEAYAGRPVSFADISLFYANLIDYSRIVLIVIAGFCCSWGYPFLGAMSILVSHLLGSYVLCACVRAAMRAARARSLVFVRWLVCLSRRLAAGSLGQVLLLGAKVDCRLD